jgi:NTE family protein
MLITAVDARTGGPVVFDRHSGVDLVDAVAASTASGPPYRIAEHRFLDGGYRRNENADLAAGCGRVLVLSPLGGRTRHPMEWGMHLAAQVDELRAGGSRVETILPDAHSLKAFGTNLMDPSTRPPAARAGHEQGRALAEKLTDFWR